MPVSAASALNVAGTDTDARDYTTASWTPTRGKVYLLAFAVLDLGGSPTVPSVSGNNITWTRVGNDVGGTTTQPAMAVWSGVADASSTAGAITFTGAVSAGQTADGAIWGLVELTEVDWGTGDGFVQSGVASTTNDTITVTLGAFSDTDNATGAWFLSYDNAGGALTNTAGSGFALVSGLDASQTMGGDTVRLSFEFRNTNDTSVDATASAANDRMLMHAVEIREGARVRADQAAATGTANNATARVAASAETATATGTASGATVKVAASATDAASTGTANGATTTISGVATAATGTGTADPAQATILGAATTATGLGQAADTTGSVAPSAIEAAATGTATDPAGNVAPATGTATGTGTGSDPAGTTQTNPSTATATTAAGDPATTVAPSATEATGFATAFDATGSTATRTDANATTATALGAADDATTTVAATASTATGTGSAETPSATVATPATAATATGLAEPATGTTGTSAGTGSGTATGEAATGTVSPGAAAATSTGAASDATVTTSGPGSANAGTGAATGTAYDASVAQPASPDAGLPIFPRRLAPRRQVYLTRSSHHLVLRWQVGGFGVRVVTRSAPTLVTVHQPQLATRHRVEHQPLVAQQPAVVAAPVTILEIAGWSTGRRQRIWSRAARAENRRRHHQAAVVVAALDELDELV